MASSEPSFKDPSPAQGHRRSTQEPLTTEELARLRVLSDASLSLRGCPAACLVSPDLTRHPAAADTVIDHVTLSITQRSVFVVIKKP